MNAEIIIHKERQLECVPVHAMKQCGGMEV
jgi:hypothetical protein